MGQRRLRDPVEIVSDIGALAYDLQHHGDEEIAQAVEVLRRVNGPMFDWLVVTLALGKTSHSTPEGSPGA